MREFTKSDWDAFAGATPSEDNRQPFINSEENPLEVTVIADAEGVQLIWYDDGDNTYAYNLNFVSYDTALIIAEKVEDYLKEIKDLKALFPMLKKLGFVQIMG